MILLTDDSTLASNLTMDSLLLFAAYPRLKSELDVLLIARDLVCFLHVSWVALTAVDGE